MGEYPCHIQQVSSPKIEYAVCFDYVFEVREEKPISEDPVWSLSWYGERYDEEVFHTLDWGNYGLAYYSCDSTRDEAL